MKALIILFACKKKKANEEEINDGDEELVGGRVCKPAFNHNLNTTKHLNDFLVCI